MREDFVFLNLANNLDFLRFLRPNIQPRAKEILSRPLLCLPTTMAQSDAPLFPSLVVIRERPTTNNNSAYARLRPVRYRNKSTHLLSNHPSPEAIGSN